MKSNRGVTIIVLVITIIVLIVLAGVAIANLAGNNSIVNKAQEGKTKSDESKINEETTLSDYRTKIETRSTGNVSGENSITENTTEEEIVEEDDWSGTYYYAGPPSGKYESITLVFTKTTLDEGSGANTYEVREGGDVYVTYGGDNWQHKGRLYLDETGKKSYDNYNMGGQTWKAN